MRTLFNHVLNSSVGCRKRLVLRHNQRKNRLGKKKKKKNNYDMNFPKNLLLLLTFGVAPTASPALNEGGKIAALKVCKANSRFIFASRILVSMLTSN